MDGGDGRGLFKVLVADSDRDVLEEVDSLLAVYGYDIRTAADGVSAWSIALAASVDLAIVDLNLSGLSGFDFIARCRVTEETANTPIIVLSATDDAAVTARAFGLGATMYLAKPLRPPQLTHHVWYVLRNQQRDAELRALRARLARDGSRAFVAA